MKFNEESPWTVEIPEPTTYGGLIAYAEAAESAELFWEIGTDPYVIIVPPCSESPIRFPQYALERVATIFRDEFLNFPTRHEIRGQEIHVFAVN